MLKDPGILAFRSQELDSSAPTALVSALVTDMRVAVVAITLAIVATSAAIPLLNRASGTATPISTPLQLVEAMRVQRFNETRYGDLALSVSYSYELSPRIQSSLKTFLEKVMLPAIVEIPSRSSKALADRVAKLLKERLALLRIVVTLRNSGSKAIYYVTDACLEAPASASRIKKLGLPRGLAVVSYPVASISISPELGYAVSPYWTTCLVLAYVRVDPGKSVSTTFYYIATVPFAGKVKATTQVCVEALGHGCRVVSAELYVRIP